VLSGSVFQLNNISLLTTADWGRGEGGGVKFGRFSSMKLKVMYVVHIFHVCTGTVGR